MANLTIEQIATGLISPYRARVTDLDTIASSLLADGIIAGRDQLVNDHLAFRTFGADRLGIASLEPLFLHHAYLRRDAYRFPGKHLAARWYSPPAEHLPRIFISELCVDELSARAQQIIHSYTDCNLTEPLERTDLDHAASVLHALSEPLWRLPRLADYESLLAESEYAAWTLYHRYELNHVALSVHELRADMRSIETLNGYLAGRGIQLNGAANAIQISADGLLRQSSTVAQKITGSFADGETADIAGAYLEFVERRILPQFADLPAASQRREHRRDGFEAANADRIFESTDLRQTQARSRR